MQVSINTADPRPIYLQIMDEIRRALVLGTLKPGDPLPSIRQLALDLRVNPNTVAQAYGELERDGTAYVQRGRGTFISPDVQPGQEERRRLARDVAKRALIDAHRNGLDTGELLDAIREVAEQHMGILAEAEVTE
jgi:GntR family transcriptional regulator